MSACAPPQAVTISAKCVAGAPRRRLVLRHEIAPRARRAGDRGREANRREARRQGPQAVPGRARADRRACWRSSACSSSRITHFSPPKKWAASLWESISAICSAWSAGCRAAERAGARGGLGAYRRFGSRSGRAGPSRRWAWRDCARCRWRAPSAARYRACGCRARDGSCGRPRERSIRLGRKPAKVLPPPVGAIRSASRPVPHLVEQVELVGARLPAPRGEPAANGPGNCSDAGALAGALARCSLASVRRARHDRSVSDLPPSRSWLP